MHSVSKRSARCFKLARVEGSEAKAAKTLDGVECTKEPVISDETIIEWKNYRRFLAQHPKEKITTQLQELATNEMMGAMYPSLKELATICLTMPVTTASVERSFSNMKLMAIGLKFIKSNENSNRITRTLNR